MNPSIIVRNPARIPANQVLVTIGTGSMVSALGTTETHRAVNINHPNRIGFAAFDARLVDIDPNSTVDSPIFLNKGQPISVEEINSRWGSQLREEMGSRFLSKEIRAAHVPTSIGAPLAHRLEKGSETGGLRERAGLRFADLRATELSDMALLFEDDPRLGPSLQAQMFLYGGLGALAALPKPLSELVPEAHRFRVAAATCFQGQDSYEALGQGMQKDQPVVEGQRVIIDGTAYRLASYLNTHGPALLTSMLSPSFPISPVRRKPERLKQLLREGSSLRNVPQAPLVSSAACASAFLNFCDIAPQIQMSASRRYNAPIMVLWTSADAALSPDARILEGFGPDAMMSREKLAKSGRPVSEALAPFDVDASGTIVGNAGYGIMVTTLEFAVENDLDITSLIVGWGQSGETGGKGHFAGVGFGGENALIVSLMMAFEDHGYGVNDFEMLFAHATGTRTNSKTDLGVATSGRLAAAEEQRHQGSLIRMKVSGPKAAGPQHPMGPAGHLATEESTHYLTGEPAVGVPTLKNPDPDLKEEQEMYKLTRDPVQGNEDGGSLSPVQGFGGYVGVLAQRSANPSSISRYVFSHPTKLQAYLEKWSESRRNRKKREAEASRKIGSILELALKHRWPGMVK